MHQFQPRGGQMTVHKLKVSISAARGWEAGGGRGGRGGQSIINVEDNSVC